MSKFVLDDDSDDEMDLVEQFIQEHQLELQKDYIEEQKETEQDEQKELQQQQEDDDDFDLLMEMLKKVEEDKNSKQEQVNEPTPEPSPEPSPEPTPTPEPSPQTSPESSPEPSPETSPEPSPEPLLSMEELDLNNVDNLLSQLTQEKRGRGRPKGSKVKVTTKMLKGLEKTRHGRGDAAINRQKNKLQEKKISIEKEQRELNKLQQRLDELENRYYPKVESQDEKDAKLMAMLQQFVLN